MLSTGFSKKKMWYNVKGNGIHKQHNIFLENMKYLSFKNSKVIGEFAPENNRNPTVFLSILQGQAYNNFEFFNINYFKFSRASHL